MACNIRPIDTHPLPPPQLSSVYAIDYSLCSRLHVPSAWDNMDCILNRRFLNKFIFIILAVIADNNRVDLLLDGSPKLSLSFIENHIVKITEDGFLNVTLPTFEEKIDYDVGETASWTVLIDYTEYNKPVNLQWYKNGRPIQNYNVKDTNSEKRYEIVDIADYHTSLTVRNVSKMDEGDFQLFINIADGNHQSFMINFTLRVRGLIFSVHEFLLFL